MPVTRSLQARFSGHFEVGRRRLAGDAGPGGAVCAAALGVAVLLGAGCKGKGTAPRPPEAAGGTGAADAAQKASAGGAGAPAPAVPLEPVGMTDPVARMQSAAAKALTRGYKGLNGKKWDECVAGFSEVVTAMPDYLLARAYVARCQVMQGAMADARGQLEELLRRNYVAYAPRTASGKDWAALRGSPEWPAYQQAEARIKRSYVHGLDGGVVLIVRMSAAKPPKYEAVKGGPDGLREARLELGQEAVHFDPATGRFRPLTSTDGKIVSALRSPDGKTLAFVLAERVQNQGAKLLFVDPQLGHVDLRTLETVGPVPIKGTFTQLSLGFSKAGAPTLGVTQGDSPAASAYQMDSARTGAVKIPDDQGLFGERNEIWVDDLQHTERRLSSDIKLAADLQSFILGEAEVVQTVTSAQKLEGSSIQWAPGRLLVSYAGVFNACEALDKTRGDKDKNGLYVYDLTKRSAQRVDAARTTYETQWASDDYLLFETGIDAESRVTLYQLKTQQKTQLPTRFGAGLYGISAHKCEDPPPVTTGEGDALPPPPAPEAGTE